MLFRGFKEAGQTNWIRLSPKYRGIEGFSSRQVVWTASCLLYIEGCTGKSVCRRMK